MWTYRLQATKESWHVACHCKKNRWPGEGIRFVAFHVWGIPPTRDRVIRSRPPGPEVGSDPRSYDGRLRHGLTPEAQAAGASRIAPVLVVQPVRAITVP